MAENIVIRERERMSSSVITGTSTEIDVYNGLFGERIGYISYMCGRLNCYPVVNNRVLWDIPVFIWSSGKSWGGVIPHKEEDNLLNICKNELVNYYKCYGRN